MVIRSLTFGYGNWICHTDTKGKRVLIRVDDTPAGVRIVEVYVPPQDMEGQRISRFISTLPLREIEDRLTRDERYRNEMRKIPRYPGIPLETLASYFDRSFFKFVDRTDADWNVKWADEAGWVRDAFVSTLGDAEHVDKPSTHYTPAAPRMDIELKRNGQVAEFSDIAPGLSTPSIWEGLGIDKSTRLPSVDDESYPDRHRVRLLPNKPWPEPGRSRRHMPLRSLKVSIPTNKPYGEDFWNEVAHVYRWLVAMDNRSPNVAIARANAVDVRRVQKWVATCRKSGLLEVSPGKGRTRSRE